MNHALPFGGIRQLLLLPDAETVETQVGISATGTCMDIRLARLKALQEPIRFRHGQQKLVWAPEIFEGATLSNDAYYIWRQYFDGEEKAFSSSLDLNKLQVVDIPQAVIDELTKYQLYFAWFSFFERRRPGVHDRGLIGFTEERPERIVCLARFARALYMGSSSPPVRCMRAIIEAQEASGAQRKNFKLHDPYGHMV